MIIRLNMKCEVPGSEYLYLVFLSSAYCTENVWAVEKPGNNPRCGKYCRHDNIISILAGMVVRRSQILAHSKTRIKRISDIFYAILI